jgi:hypothetical protein
MGIPLGGSVDSAMRKTVGTFAATGQSGWMDARMSFPMNVALFGTFVATVALECSFDGGTTAIPVSRDALGTPATFTAPVRLVVQEGEGGVPYRWNCTAYTSGTVSWRLSE